MTEQERFIDEVKKMKNPVIILHPDNKIDFFKSPYVVKYHHFMPVDKIIATDESNLWQF